MESTNASVAPKRLVATGIGKEFGHVRALAGVDMSVGQREILGLIGPNGSGKTTLLNAITGVVKPDAGSFELEDVSWRWLPPHRIARLGIARTFQSVRLFVGMTVFENVRVAATASLSARAARERALEVMAELGLERHGDQLVENLPYGLRRATELARALAERPAFVLLDEPAAGLDGREAQELGEMLQRIRSEHGCGVVVVDHDVGLIMRSCDSVLVLHEGAVIAHGAPSEVRRDPAVISAYLGS
ncbi:MAG: branched-chain amino acid transport system ATP-binding protein livM [Thermoleophilaceae bacterium]|jgi:ABC-type branched-subunit amino acid transport system ATPase component|nr:branched-chain amino acid transport system ATP-binding protein livM [Thermoleophilaceae bacterium]